MTDAWDSSPEDLRELIAAERACPAPAPEAQERVLVRLAGSIGLAAGSAGSPSSPEPTALVPQAPSGGVVRIAGHLSRRGVTAFLLGAAVGATTMGTVDHIYRRPEMPPSQPSLQVTPPPAAPPPLPEPEPVAQRAASSPESSPAVRRSQGLAESRDKRLEAERKLVEMARTSLARGQDERALSALRRHLRLFPKGELAEERDSLWVSVLVAMREDAQAREHAERFHRRYPSSLFGPMVDQALKSIP